MKCRTRWRNRWPPGPRRKTKRFALSWMVKWWAVCPRPLKSCHGLCASGIPDADLMANRRKKSWRRFERRHDTLAPVSVYVQRILGSLVVAAILMSLALVVGIVGYHFIA